MARLGPLERGRHETLLESLAIAHAAALLTIPSIPVIALGLWWNANTIAHNFIHRPFYRSTAANRAFSAYLSLVLGIPQSLWRRRHLQHHAEAVPGGHARRRPITTAIVIETLLVVAMWGTMALLVPRFFLMVYAPGWALGLALCHLQGHFEHACGTTSHYGRLYNWLFFNDGYHIEHHLRPAARWSELPALAGAPAKGSRWPPVLRWMERGTRRSGLEILEACVLRSRLLQRFVINRHERAFRTLLPMLGPIARVTIVGGGLFPRTALILRRLMPNAAITIVDGSAANLVTARQFIPPSLDARAEQAPGGMPVTFVNAVHTPGMVIEADLVVMPLAYRGDRRRIYREPPAARVIVHDWIWSARSTTAVVSWFLLKRLNLISPGDASALPDAYDNYR